MSEKQAYPTLPTGYSLIRKLGQGGYGNVYLCREYSTGKEIAVKQLENDESGISSLMEANIMATISQPYLVSSHKIVTDKDNLFIFQEKATCDLGYLVRKKECLPTPNVLRHWSFFLVQALACLHRQGIVHGDIKASNVLFFGSNSDVVKGGLIKNPCAIKLADFNLAQKIWVEDSKVNFRCCTCTHRPLEVWLGYDWDFSMDIWALGCTLFEMAYGIYLFPYQGWEDDTVPKYILKERFVACLEDFAKRNPYGKQKIPFSFKREEKVKFIPYQLSSSFYHPDYSLFNQLVFSMLRFNPKERPKIKAILDHPYFHGLSPIPYQTITAAEDPLHSRKVQKYIEQLKKFTSQATVLETSLMIIRKIQHLKFRNYEHDDDRLRVLGAYWIANKLVLRRSPSLPYPSSLLYDIERIICEYLSYRLI